VGLVMEGRKGGSDALSFEAAACIPDLPHKRTRKHLGRHEYALSELNDAQRREAPAATELW
jgi:hypothetical protein